MSERNIPVTIMLTSEEWSVFAEIAAKQNFSNVSTSIEKTLEDTVTVALALREKGPGEPRR